MCKYNYFTVRDLIKSTTASHRGINNQPNAKVRKELKSTARKVNLISFVAHLKGANIWVTSGYRCKKVNELVGGVENSLHMKGRAVDFIVSNDKLKHELFKSLTDPVMYKILGICEIVEHEHFIHVGFKKKHTEN